MLTRPRGGDPILRDRSQCQQFVYCHNITTTTTTTTEPPINTSPTTAAPQCLPDGFLASQLSTELPDVALANVCLPPHSSRVILIVAEALCGFEQRPSHPCLMLPILDELRPTHENHTRLYQFTDDPTVARFHRTRALTTGNLQPPTFFIDTSWPQLTGRAAVGEDNIIDQLRSAGGRAVHIGDRIWSDMYPHQFERSHAMMFGDDSHTVVDREITRLVATELQRHDWQLLVVAHTLGIVPPGGGAVDCWQCAMDDKLDNNDELIRSIVDRMSAGDTLLVVGDDSMTMRLATTELRASTPSLFAYSVGAEFLYHDGPLLYDVSPHMSLVDVAPTLAVLLGVAMPFASVGHVRYGLMLATSDVAATASRPALARPIGYRNASDDDSDTMPVLNARQYYRYVLPRYLANPTELATALVVSDTDADIVVVHNATGSHSNIGLTAHERFLVHAVQNRRQLQCHRDAHRWLWRTLLFWWTEPRAEIDGMRMALRALARLPMAMDAAVVRRFRDEHVRSYADRLRGNLDTTWWIFELGYLVEKMVMVMVSYRLLIRTMGFYRYPLCRREYSKYWGERIYMIDKLFVIVAINGGWILDDLLEPYGYDGRRLAGYLNVVIIKLL